jgi:hypothetical protein
MYCAIILPLFPQYLTDIKNLISRDRLRQNPKNSLYLQAIIIAYRILRVLDFFGVVNKTMASQPEQHIHSSSPPQTPQNL